MFNVTPHNQERRTKRGTVKLYYVGVDYDRAHKGFPPPVQIKTLDPVQMPKLGDYLEIDEVYAKDLIFKTRYKDHEKVLRDSFISEAQGGAEMARFIRQAIKDGQSLDAKDLQRQAVKAQAEQLLPNSDLAELLRQRGIEPPPELLEKIKEQAEESSSMKSLLKAEDLVVDLRSDQEKQAAQLVSRAKKKEID